MADDYYSLIKVSRDASTEDIQTALRHERISWSNRANIATNATKREEAEERVKLLGVIKAVLTDPDRRAEYDKTLPGNQQDKAPKPVLPEIDLDSWLEKFKANPSPRSPTPTFPFPQSAPQQAPPPTPPPPPPPPPPPRPLPPPTLLQVIGGRWAIEVRTFWGVQTLMLNLTVFPSGQCQFGGNFLDGPVAVQGQGQVMGNQLSLQGVRTIAMPWPQQYPYAVVVTFNSWDNFMLSGVTNVGETVIWRRQG
jgi:hypothetical protein